MALITCKELIEEVYSRMAQDTEIAQAAVAATDDNPTYKRAKVLRLINAAQDRFRTRLNLDIWRTTVDLDYAEGPVELPETFLGSLQLVFWLESRPQKRLIPADEQWLDQNFPQWRNREGDSPLHYILKQDEDVATVTYSPQPSTEIEDAVKAYFLERATELADDDDECTTLALFPQIADTVFVHDVLRRIIPYGSTTAADQRAAYYDALYEADIKEARKVGKRLVHNTDIYMQG